MDIYSDGGARGNPGRAACAFVIIDEGKVFHKDSKYLGVTTNNQAEYMGVLLALKWLSKNSKNNMTLPIIFFMDSELIVNQINGRYKVKDKKLKEHFLEVTDLLKKIPTKIIFKNVPREKNKLADFLVNETLDVVQ